MENKPESLAKLRKRQLSTNGPFQLHPPPSPCFPRVWEERERMGLAAPLARRDHHGVSSPDPSRPQRRQWWHLPALGQITPSIPNQIPGSADVAVKYSKLICHKSCSLSQP